LRRSKNLQYLIAEVVNGLHRDLARPGRVERLARRAVQLGPLPLVDLRAQCLLQLFVGFVGAQEIGVADEEALAVVRMRLTWPLSVFFSSTSLNSPGAAFFFGAAIGRK